MKRTFVRNIRFTLTSEQNSIIGERFETRINEQLLEGMSCETSQSGSNTIYTVTMGADSARHSSELTCAFLDGNAQSGNSSLSGGQSDENRLNQITYQYTDKIDLTLFLGGSSPPKVFITVSSIREALRTFCGK